MQPLKYDSINIFKSDNLISKSKGWFIILSLCQAWKWTCRNYLFHVWQSGIGLYVAESGDDNDDGDGASERFHCRRTSNRGIMGIVCCWISIQAASSQQQRRTSHFFRFGDSTLPLLLRSLPCAGLLDSSPTERISESFRKWTRPSWPREPEMRYTVRITTDV